MTKKNPIIDICKLYCSFLVVFIHVYEIRGTSAVGDTLIACFCQMAVPFFFLVSGFLIGHKLDDPKYIKRKILHLITLYCAWVIIWLPSIIKIYLDENNSFFYFIGVLSRRVLLAGYGVYWYILVLAESILVLYLLRKKNWIIVFLSGVGLFLGYCYDYSLIPIVKHTFYYVFSWSNNVIMKGIPFVYLGVLIRQHQSFLQDKYKLSAFLFLLSTVIDIIIYQSSGHGILFPLEAFFLFGFSVYNWGLSIETKKLRDASTVFFFTHTIFIYLVLDPIWGPGFNVWLKYLFTVFACFFCFLIIKRINNKWINWLVSV